MTSRSRRGLLAFAWALGFSVLAPSVAAPPTASSPTVCIDPGHPSEVSRGAVGKHITEMHANWEVALKLATILEQEGIHVVLTKRSEDQLVRNRARAEIANDAHADLMLRLHCDDAPGSGIAVYIPERQAVFDGCRGPSPQVIRECREDVGPFHAAMIAGLHGSLRDRGIRPDTETAVGGRHGALIGSIFSKVPVILVEMCVLTNSHDGAFIASEKGQSTMARALAAGVNAVVGMKSHTDGRSAR